MVVNLELFLGTYSRPTKGELLGYDTRDFFELIYGGFLWIDLVHQQDGSTGCQDDTFKAHTDGHAYGDKLLKLHLSVCFFSSSIHW